MSKRSTESALQECPKRSKRATITNGASAPVSSSEVVRVLLSQALAIQGNEDATALVSLADVARSISHFLSIKAPCYECGDAIPVKDLRSDRSYWNTGEKICKDCWFFCAGGTPARPDFEPPPWPSPLEEAATDPAEFVKLDGKLWLGDKVVGHAYGYCDKTRFAKKVHLFECGEANAEPGTIDPAHKFVAFKNLV
jgi:hypothetical protein